MTSQAQQQRIATLEKLLVNGTDLPPLPTFVYHTMGRDNEQQKKVDIVKAFDEYKARHKDNKQVQSFNTVDELFSFVENNDEAKNTIIGVIFEDLSKKRPRENAPKGLNDDETIVEPSIDKNQITVDEYLESLPSDIEKDEGGA